MIQLISYVGPKHTNKVSRTAEFYTTSGINLEIVSTDQVLGSNSTLSFFYIQCIQVVVGYSCI